MGKYIFNENEAEQDYFFKDNLESQWYVGDEIGQINNSSIELYGWLYSDESYIWPNNSTLYIANYPKMLTLTSDGATQEHFPNVVGTYEMIPGLTNMRPRWRNTERNIYLFYGAIYVWQFFAYGSDRILKGKESSEGKILLPSNDQWTLEIYGNTFEDNTITNM